MIDPHSIDSWLVNGAGLALMAAIAIWFWLWKPGARTATVGDVIDIKVANGVYEPAYLEVKRGSTVTLNFHREDASPCAEQVIFHGLDISAQLPLGSIKSIRITPQQIGSYRFTCQMQMYQGKLIVAP